MTDRDIELDTEDETPDPDERHFCPCECHRVGGRTLTCGECAGNHK